MFLQVFLLIIGSHFHRWVDEKIPYHVRTGKISETVAFVYLDIFFGFNIFMLLFPFRYVYFTFVIIIWHR